MRILIGIQNVQRELEIDVPIDAVGVKSAVAEALSSGAPLVFTDSEGKSVIVPIHSLGYVTTAADKSRNILPCTRTCTLPTGPWTAVGPPSAQFI